MYDGATASDTGGGVKAFAGPDGRGQALEALDSLERASDAVGADKDGGDALHTAAAQLNPVPFAFPVPFHNECALHIKTALMVLYIHYMTDEVVFSSTSN
ncbi:hypothetical protein ACJX0J_015359 [Zea mays]